MANLRFTIAYDGSSFLGWQKTEMGRSVEATLQSALQQITQQKIILQAASRTDAGVHAHHQVVNCQIDPLRYSLERLQLSLNQILPKDLVILAIEEVPLSFHATLDAKEKEYRYTIDTSPVQLPLERFSAWHLPYKLNLDSMREAAAHLVGTHDFAAFCNVRKNDPVEETIRTLREISIQSDNQKITLSIIGNRFLYRMARNITGTLAWVGRGEFKVASIPSILSSKDRRKAGPTAPSHGLTLHKIFYNPFL